MNVYLVELGRPAGTGRHIVTRTLEVVASSSIKALLKAKERRLPFERVIGVQRKPENRPAVS